MAMDTLAHRLIFIRHGETDWNVEGRLQGQHDIPLNGRGRDQAASAGREARKYIAREGLTDLRYVASPLTRTRDTMELARGAMGLDPKDYALDPRLMELSFGRWEGLMFLAYYAAYVAWLVLDASGHDALGDYRTVMLYVVLPLTAVTIGVLTWRGGRAAPRA
jgi:broad specificity phosphatase PhoE